MRTSLLLRASLLVPVLFASSCDSASDAVLNPLPPGDVVHDGRPMPYSAPFIFYLSTGRTDSSHADADCPRVTRGATETVVEGGCVDSGGTRWSGRLTFPNDFDPMAPVPGAIVLDGFGDERDSACDGLRESQTHTGRVDIVRAADGSLEFDTDFIYDLANAETDTCTIERQHGAWQYHGRITLDGARSTWSGSGRIGSDLIGRFDIATDGEVIDHGVCASEALSGTTRVSAGGHEVVLTYDGGTDCDEEGTVTWTHDGVDQGEIDGIQCSAAPGSRGSAAALVAIMAALALVIARRRAR